MESPVAGPITKALSTFIVPRTFILRKQAPVALEVLLKEGKALLNASPQAVLPTRTRSFAAGQKEACKNFSKIVKRTIEQTPN